MPILFIDLDYTLLRTSDFSHALARLMADKSICTTKEFISTLEKGTYYKTEGNLGHYDFFSHAETLGIDKDTAIRLINEALKGDDFLFEDAKQLLDQLPSMDVEPRILTYGETEFQLLKKDIVESLTDIPVDAVMEPKGQWIARNYPSEKGFLVDDKPHQKLPKGFMEITIDRAAGDSISRIDGIYIINSLTRVREIVDIKN